MAQAPTGFVSASAVASARTSNNYLYSTLSEAISAARQQGMHGHIHTNVYAVVQDFQAARATAGTGKESMWRILLLMHC